MGISIKNEDVERLARQIAARQGISITEAIRRGLIALRDTPKDKPTPKEIADKRKKIKEIQARVARKWVEDGKTIDDIIGYDEIGLP